MNILDFFFGIFKECFNTMNVDFFGFGFTWLELILGVAIIFVVMNFLKSVVGVGDSIAFDNLVHGYKMANKERENEIVSMTMTHNLDDDSYTITKSTFFKDKNTTYREVTRVGKDD